MEVIMKIRTAVGVFILSSGLATAALAGPAPGQRPATNEALISKVADYVCIRDERGWHHMRGTRRVVCKPVRPRGAFWGWRCEGPRCGWWHRNDRRWHDQG
jgi:hypothetical protein